MNLEIEHILAEVLKDQCNIGNWWLEDIDIKYCCLYIEKAIQQANYFWQCKKRVKTGTKTFAIVTNILTVTKFTWDDSMKMLLIDEEHA